MMKRIVVFVLCLVLLLLSLVAHGRSQQGSEEFNRFGEIDQASIKLGGGAGCVDRPGNFFVRQEVKRIVLTLPQAKGAWLIEINRSGGMRPRKSSVSLNSAGDISVTSEHFARGSSIVDCSLKERVSAKDLRALKQAIASAKPAEWKDRYDDPAHPICCDQPTTSLTLRWRASDGSTKTYSTSWYPGSAKLRPADLVKIQELIEPLWDKTSEKCEKSN
jgi:hypothetical protein